MIQMFSVYKILGMYCKWKYFKYLIYSDKENLEESKVKLHEVTHWSAAENGLNVN